MDPTLVTEFEKLGPQGLTMLILIGAVIAVWRVYVSCSESRIADADKQTERYIGLVTKQIESANSTNTILEVLREKISK